MLLKAYLENHFVDKATFAALAGISIDRLDQLITAGAIPGATYICDGASIWSAIFGRTPIMEGLTGEYFRPECVRWVKIADHAPGGSERHAVLVTLTKELRAASDDHHETEEDPESKIQEHLPYFFDGTYGLCVADPSTGAGIMRKVLLQEKLTELTKGGIPPLPAGTSKEELLKLIGDYADAAMPFSPAEYERSSRKRLVDDLWPIVGAA